MALKEGYIGVTERLQEFRKDHPKGSIVTSVKTDLYDFGETGKSLVNTVTAVISDGEGKILGTGHDQGEGGNDKELAKTETAAVGRALVHAGYKALDESLTEEVEAEVQEAKKASSRFSREAKESRFNRSEATAPKTEVKEETAPKTAAAPVETSTASKEAAPVEAKAPTASPTSKVSELYAKYNTGNKANTTSMTGMRR